MKKGFVFIETIVTVVILCGALIYLHSSYNNIINNEEERVYMMIQHIFIAHTILENFY